MEYTRLGRTGIKVSKICFGALTIGPLQANLPIEVGAGVIRYALEKGVNFIDTAEMYRTYPYIKSALKGYNNDVVLATKSYAYDREGMAKSLEEARAKLDRDVIDVFLLHEQESLYTIKGHWEAFEYLLEAKAKGLVRAVGISTHRIEAVKAVLAVPEMDVIHPLYNVRGLGIHDGTREEMYNAIEQVHAKGVGVYSMKPLGGGNLRLNAKEAISHLLGLPAIDSIAIGMKDGLEVDVNCDYFSGLDPDQEKLSKVNAIERSLLISDWCQGCGACVDRCHSKALSIVGDKAIVEPSKCLLCGYCAGVCKEFCIKTY